jgi:polysaccharide pyruvyl transferase CsaB
MSNASGSGPKRKAILVSGNFGFGNLGDEAILEAVVGELRRRDPKVEIIAVSGSPRETALRLSIGAADFFSPDQVSAAVSRSSVVLFGLGEVFQDYWGATASSLWRADTTGIEAHVRPALLADLHGVPSVLFCADVGPLRSEVGKRMLSLACRNASLLIARDEASAEELIGAGVPRTPLLATDPAFLLSAAPEDEKQIAQRRSPEKPFVAFALRSWKLEVSDKDLAAAAGRAAANLPTGWEALFVPLCRGAVTDDREIARLAIEASGGRGTLFEVETPGEAIALFSRARTVVAGRMHAVILAALGGVPAVSLAYDRKVSSVAGSLGLAGFVLPLSEIGRLSDSLAEAAAANPSLRSVFARARDSCRNSARQSFDLLEQISEGPPAAEANLEEAWRALGEERRRRLEAEGDLRATEQELLEIHRSRLWKLAGFYRSTRRALRRLLRPGRRGQRPAVGRGAPPTLAPITRDCLYDIVCLPIIDWDFRFQRPQQVMTQFAEAGHRVFYVAQKFRNDGPAYEIRSKRQNVYEVSLRGPERNTYQDALDSVARDVLFASLDALRRDLSLGATATFVQLPFWWPLAKKTRAEFGWPVVYDCMDDHSGFSTNRPEMIEQEKDLLSSAGLVTASSRLLDQEARKRNANVLLLPNACDYEHFANIGKARNSRPVVGYYGAIADWFDSDLVADLAERRPDWDFLLVGSTFTADTSRLSKLPNVSLPGEKPYAEIPRWLEKFDVAILPFKRLPLTEATNPVKAFEILAGGKPLVSVPIPEVAPLAPLVRLASTAKEFETEIAASLAESDPELVTKRRTFAQENTWKNRFDLLAPAVSRTFPKASIVVVTFNNLELNRFCLESLYERTEWPNFEVIVADNGSTDGTAAYLSEARERFPNLHLVLNETNRGFAAASNAGLAAATGEYFVLLNNDTVLARGWLSALIRHLHVNPDIGLIGPATNAIGNEARVAAGYDRIENMPVWAAEYVRRHDGELLGMSMLGMFCVAMRRTTFERVGPLDERFGIGMFEDDDYAHRLRETGYRIVCARDSFVHHWMRASFRKMPKREYRELFTRNQTLFEQKWGIAWQPHGRPARRASQASRA